MNTPSEFVNPALAEALIEADDSRNRNDHINNMIVTVAKAMLQDTFEHRTPLYTRKNFTIGALVAYDPEVRLVVSRAGGNIAAFDQVIAVATQAIVSECCQNNPLGAKLSKAIRDLYANGQSR